MMVTVPSAAIFTNATASNVAGGGLCQQFRRVQVECQQHAASDNSADMQE